MDLTIVILLVLLLMLLLLALGGLLLLRTRSKRDAPPAQGKRIKSPVPGVTKQPDVKSKVSQPKPAKSSRLPATKPSPAASKTAVKLASPPEGAPSPTPAPVSPPASSDNASPIAGPLREGVTLGDKIRILVVDDNQETIEHVDRLLYFEDDMEIIGQAISGQQGIEIAVKRQPHIVLMDINMPDMDGITATQQLTKRVPFSQVIMISVQSDPEYMKQAMIAGARDYQPKPFSAEELISCIRRVYEIGQPVYQRFSTARVAESQVAGSDPVTEGVTGQKGAAIAIYSPKGGVGTSTIAANLAAVLQKIEGSIVLMDADLQFGDILVHLNTHDSRNICNLIQGDEFDLELLPDVLVPHKTGLKLLLAPPKPEMAELIKPAMITQVIDELRNRFKIVVIDTQNLLTDQTLAVLDSADQIFIVTVPELPAIKSVKLFLDLGHELNLTAKRMSLILNNADQFGGIPLRQIEGALKLPKTYQISHDPTVYTNINSGKVITEQRSNTPFVQAMVHLAQATKQELAEAQAALTAETA